MRARRWQATGPDGVADLEVVESEIPAPGRGEAVIDVQAAGLNPADLKHAAKAAAYPWPIGYEVAGTIAAIGPDTRIASGGGAVGDAVLAFRVRGGLATRLTVPARDVFARPDGLGVVDAATLLLAATTAADLLHVTGVASGDTVLVSGFGAVGIAVAQLARGFGAETVVVTGADTAAVVGSDGVTAVERGPGVVARILHAAPHGVTAALDSTGSDEFLDAALTLVADRGRIVTVANPARAAADGFRAIAGVQPASAAYRDSVRAALIARAAAGELRIPVARTFPFDEAPDALALVASGHPGGKVALVF